MTSSQYKLVILFIFFFALILRFWNINQFNSLVFDEVYYAKFANNYLIGTHFFNSHPPLSAYIIAIGIWIGSHFPAPPDSINNLTGSLRSSFSYRWINALSGSFIPILVGAIAYQLVPRRRYSAIVALLVLLDGLFLVESRYALNNIYLVLFGLLGQLLFLISLQGRRQNIFLLGAGICFGCSVAVKWNGLSFLLGIFFMLILSKNKNYPNWRRILISLIAMPAITYSVLWIPHLILNPQYNFWQVHQEILTFHQKIGGNESHVHPYCSSWYSWIVMWRPIAYVYETKLIGNQKIIQDVHAMGNPILWWLSSLAILSFIILLGLSKIRLNNRPEANFLIYCVCNYAAHLLPWFWVSRCTFIYHYLGAYVFAILALAWFIDVWLSNQSSKYRILGVLTLFLITSAFIYWLPIYLGIPLKEGDFQLRMFFNNWI